MNKENKTDKKQLDYARKYHNQFEDIKIRCVPGEREAFREYAISHGWKSLNACVLHLLNYAMSHELTADKLSVNGKKTD